MPNVMPNDTHIHWMSDEYISDLEKDLDDWKAEQDQITRTYSHIKWLAPVSFVIGTLLGHFVNAYLMPIILVIAFLIAVITTIIYFKKMENAEEKYRAIRALKRLK